MVHVLYIAEWHFFSVIILITIVQTEGIYIYRWKHITTYWIRFYCFLNPPYVQCYTLFLEENVAFGKRTWQEHPWPDPNYYSGDNAVDGLYTDRSLTGRQCSMSANDQYTATWRVDLGNVFRISYINIYYRTENKISMSKPLLVY